MEFWLWMPLLFASGYVRSYWWLISSAGKLNLPGRPRIAESLAQIIVDMKLANPSYGAERIAALVKEELLAHIIPISDSHLNRLLVGEFKTYYNTARPHQANQGLTPDQAEASNDKAFVPVPFDPESLWVEEIPWLAGLHHSYRRVA